MRLATPAQMRAIDAAAADFGLGPELLMEAAGTLAADHVDRHPGRVTILCGPGHNGADGMVVARHLRARPAVSAAHLVGDDLGVFCHGRAQFLTPEDPDWAPIEAHLTAHYGSSPSSWDADIVYVRIAPHWMVGYAGDKAALLARARGTTYGDLGAAGDGPGGTEAPASA